MMHKEKNLGNTYLFGATEVGRTHTIMGNNNQDCFGFDVIDENYVFAVSDGVGACKCAEKGSNYAVQAVMEVFFGINNHQIDFDETVVLERIIEYWLSKVTDNRINDYCSTLKFVIKYYNRFILASIGDGNLIAYFADAVIKSSDAEKTFTNETTCLYKDVTADDFWHRTYEIGTEDSKYTIFLATDGISDGIAYGKELDLVGEINDGLCISELKDEIISLINEISKYSNDDKTLGIIKHEI